VNRYVWLVLPTALSVPLQTFALLVLLTLPFYQLVCVSLNVLLVHSVLLRMTVSLARILNVTFVLVPVLFALHVTLPGHVLSRHLLVLVLVIVPLVSS